MTKTTTLKNIVFATAVLALGACAMPMMGGESAPCPAVGILPEAEKVTFFDGTTTDDLKPNHGEKHITTMARFGGYRGNCVLKNNKLQFSLDVDFSGQRGKSGGALNEQGLPYFVAVLGPDEKILQRDAFQTAVLFNDAGQGVAREKHMINLPLDPNIKDAKEAVVAAVKSQRVIMGFILTPEQLDYNTAPSGPAISTTVSAPAAKPALKKKDKK